MYGGLVVGSGLCSMIHRYPSNRYSFISLVQWRQARDHGLHVSSLVPAGCSSKEWKRNSPEPEKPGFSQNPAFTFVQESCILSRQQRKDSNDYRDANLRDATLHLDNAAGSLSQQTCKQAADRAGICDAAPG